MDVPPKIQLEPQPGYIHLFRFIGITDEYYKIGQTRDLRSRCFTLRLTNQRKTILIAYGKSRDANFSEKYMFNKFYRYCRHGEYFDFSIQNIPSVIIH
jgi:hypothetical protein